jgi:TolA-binding protein
VAEYRLGRYRDAVATFTQAQQRRTPGQGNSHPQDLPLLTLTQYQVGQIDEAKKTFGQLQETLKEARRAKSAESLPFLREAEALVQGEVEKAPKDK